jgi:hypothetical protein
MMIKPITFVPRLADGPSKEIQKSTLENKIYSRGLDKGVEKV